MAALFPFMVDGDTLFDTLSLPGIGAGQSVGYGDAYAQSFRMGPTALYLANISINISPDAQYPPGQNTAPFTLNIYSGTSLPETLMATLSGPAHPTSGISTYIPSAPVTLTAGATYWVSAQAGGSLAFYDWMVGHGNPVGGTSETAWYNPTLFRWETYALDPNNYLQMRVETAPVPEPSVAALGIILVLAAGWRRCS